MKPLGNRQFKVVRYLLPVPNPWGVESVAPEDIEEGGHQMIGEVPHTIMQINGKWGAWPANVAFGLELEETKIHTPAVGLVKP